MNNSIIVSRSDCENIYEISDINSISCFLSL